MKFEQVPNPQQASEGSADQEPLSERIASLLYTYESPEYRERARIPNYRWGIDTATQRLRYFGANHSRDSENPQYPLLREYWESFLDGVDPATAAVAVEGGVRRVRSTEEEAIRMDSEAGLITLLASQADIPCFSPEPDQDAERQFLEERFPKNLADYYYQMRMVAQWNRIPGERPELESYVGRIGDRFRVTHTTLTGRTFDPHDADLLYRLSDPTRKDNPLQEMLKTKAVYRDTCIVENLVATWREGKSLFVPYGGAHAILQERALRTLCT